MTAEILRLTGLDTAAPASPPELEPLPAEESPLALESAPDMMSPETLSRVLDGVKVATLALWRTGKNVETRRGPAYSKIGGLVRYSKPDVISWLASHRVATSEQA